MDDEQNIVFTIENALKLSIRRERLGKHSPVCWKCKTRQVQLISHINGIARWKCRHCNFKFVYEPLIIF